MHPCRTCHVDGGDVRPSLRDPQGSIHRIVGAGRIRGRSWRTGASAAVDGQIVGAEIEVNRERGTQFVRSRGRDAELVRTKTRQLRIGAGVAIGRERPRGTSETQHGLTLLSKDRRVLRDAAAARLAIGQNLRQHHRHVAPDSRAVILELLDYAVEVSRAGIARHEPLDQLPADIRRNIVIVHDLVDRPIQLSKTVLVIRMREGGSGAIGLRTSNRRDRVGGVEGESRLLDRSSSDRPGRSPGNRAIHRHGKGLRTRDRDREGLIDVSRRRSRTIVSARGNTTNPNGITRGKTVDRGGIDRARTARANAADAHAWNLAGGRRSHHAVEQELRSQIVLAGDENHGVQVIRRRAKVRRRAAARLIRLRVVPSGEQRGQSRDLNLRIGGHQAAIGIEDIRAIVPLPVQADREELHDLAGIVFIRMPACRIVALLIGAHVEVETHGRREGHGLEDATEGAAARETRRGQAVVDELIVVVGENASVVVQRTGVVIPRHHHDLAHRKGEALAELVGAGNGLLPPSIREESGRIRSIDVRGDSRDDIVGGMTCGFGELVGHPSRKTERLHIRDIGRAGAKGRVIEEASRTRVGVRNVRGSRVGVSSRIGRRLLAVDQVEVSTNLTRRKVHRVDIHIDFPGFDRFHDLRGAGENRETYSGSLALEAAHRRKDPGIAAVRRLAARSHVRIIDVEDDLSLGMEDVIRTREGIHMQVVSRPRRSEILIVEMQDALRLALVYLETCGAAGLGVGGALWAKVGRI